MKFAINSHLMDAKKEELMAESKKSSVKQTAVEYSLYWIQATIFQGNRLINAEKIDYHQYSITRMEEQFFLNSVNKSIRWLKDLKKQNILVSEVDIFLSVPSTPNLLSLVRNKREHDDEYFGSQGKVETLSDVSNPDNKLKIYVGQSVTIHKNGRIFLGGTIDVQEIIDTAKILEVSLRTKQHELWEKKSFGNIKNVEHFLAPKNLITK